MVREMSSYNFVYLGAQIYTVCTHRFSYEMKSHVTMQ